MSEWRECTIADLVEINRATYSPKEGWPFVNYLDTGSVTENNIEQIQYLDVATDKVPSRARRKAVPGSIVYSTVRPNQRHYALIKSVPENFLVSTGFAVLDVKPDVADERFVYSYLTQQGVVDKLQSITEQGVCTYPALNPDDIGALTIRIPSLPTQRKIAAVLGALDDKIELNRKMNANLEAMAQALFKSWFVDFEPFGGKMPEGWKVGRLDEIAEVNPNRKLAKGDEVPFVEMASLSTNSPFPIAVERTCYAGGMKFQNGDTIMARITPCLEHGKAGYVNFLDEGMVGFGSTEYVTMCSSSVVPNEFFYFLVKDPEFMAYAIKHMNGSSGRQRVSGQDIAAYELPIATEPVYQKIKPCFKEAMEKIRINSLQSRTLAQLRDTLLPKLMSGELDVEAVKVEA